MDSSNYIKTPAFHIKEGSLKPLSKNRQVQLFPDVTGLRGFLQWIRVGGSAQDEPSTTQRLAMKTNKKLLVKNPNLHFVLVSGDCALGGNLFGRATKLHSVTDEETSTKIIGR